jgi:hypothetical protein
VLTGVVLFIVGEIVLQLVKKVSVSLLVQMELLVFVIGPLYMLTIASLVNDGGLPQPAGIPLIFGVVALQRVLMSNVLF